MFDPKRTFKVKDELITSCIRCGHVEEIPCTDEQWANYVRREKCVQNIFPDIPSGTREMLISGYCGICYDLDTGFPNIITDEFTDELMDAINSIEPYCVKQEMMPKDNTELLDLLEELECDVDMDDERVVPMLTEVRRLIIERIDKVAKEMGLC